MPKEAFKKAEELIVAIQQSLAAGTKHFHPKSGEELKTVKEVLQCLADVGSVNFEVQKVN
jgi:predicted transcriptional regulator